VPQLSFDKRFGSDGRSKVIKLTGSLPLNNSGDAVTLTEKYLFATGIWWTLSKASSEKGGYIIQHVTSTELGWDYWELWRVAPMTENPVRAADALDILTKQKNNILGELAGGIRALNGTSNIARRLFAIQSLILLAEGTDPMPDDIFAGLVAWSATKPVKPTPGAVPKKEVTITGKAYYIDDIQEANLPKGVFKPGGAPTAGNLLSAEYKPNKKQIDDFLAMYEKQTSKPVTQSVTAVTKFVTGAKSSSWDLDVTGTPTPPPPKKR
jgi:hypothetical protein